MTDNFRTGYIQQYIERNGEESWQTFLASSHLHQGVPTRFVLDDVVVWESSSEDSGQRYERAVMDIILDPKSVEKLTDDQIEKIRRRAAELNAINFGHIMVSHALVSISRNVHTREATYFVTFCFIEYPNTVKKIEHDLLDPPSTAQGAS